MRRIILDTNIYGEIIERDDADFVLNNIYKSGMIVYGCDAITKELRKVSKEKITISQGKKKKLRSLILGLYRAVVKRDLPITKEILEIANTYYSAYKKIGGITSKEKILTDFIIVALASKNNLEVIYSNDNQTMLSSLAMKSYDIVNSIMKTKTPKFKNYGDFKNDIKM